MTEEFGYTSEYRIEHRLSGGRWTALDPLAEQHLMPANRRGDFARIRLGDWRNPEVNRDAQWVGAENYRLSVRQVTGWMSPDSAEDRTVVPY